jgi:hypothetical protein
LIALDQPLLKEMGIKSAGKRFKLLKLINEMAVNQFVDE